MELKLYNTASRTKEAFRPLDPKNVRIYVCGPTVYDFAHIGNARPVVVFDVLFRLLRHLYGERHVTYVRNITDVDDKINARAAERGIDIRQLTEETYANFKADVAALGCLPPSHEPRATDHITGMVAMIERLIAAGHAYAAEGHVLFDVASKPDYGKLARRSLDEMIAGARVDVAPYKKNPMDFVLWKPSSADQPGWESPWGRGRPGWHIECSAMSAAFLGESFDIHGGGIDLVFPHHENEIAQSECAHGGKRLANVWMHNGFLQVEGEKAAKSTGTLRTIRDVLEDMTGDVFRLSMLKTHYRQPIDWSARSVAESADTINQWHGLVIGGESHVDSLEPKPGPAVLAALLDDLNTPKAISEMHQLAQMARRGDDEARRNLGATLKFFGLVPKRLLDDVAIAVSARIDARNEIRSSLTMRGIDLDVSIAKRNAARKVKNFKEADRIRDELLAQGIVLKDGPDGTTWELKR
jgi:cysteinyl-tRNA synthetase